MVWIVLTVFFTIHSGTDAGRYVNYMPCKTNVDLYRKTYSASKIILKFILEIINENNVTFVTVTFHFMVYRIFI